MVNPTKVEDMSSILQQYDLNILGMTRGYHRNGDVDENDRKFALNLSMNADIVIFCFGLDEISESEGLDRTHMRIPQDQIDLLQDISKVNENVIGILSAGSAIEMPWHTCCKSNFAWLSEWTGRRFCNIGYSDRKSESIRKTGRNVSYIL